MQPTAAVKHPTCTGDHAAGMWQLYSACLLLNWQQRLSEGWPDNRSSCCTQANGLDHQPQARPITHTYSRSLGTLYAINIANDGHATFGEEKL